MSVKMMIPAGLRHFTREQEIIEVEGSTVGECLNHLVGQFPEIKSELFEEDGGVLRYVDIYVNGMSSFPEELAKPVKDGDKLYILRIIAGG